MAQAHLDRLTSIDSSFLSNESSDSHMHVGAVLIFEGPPPSYDDFLEHVRSRLALVPRFRQKLAFPPVQTGRPFWVDDPNFNLAYHVRHSALPAPGSEEQLRNIAGRLFSQALDRSKPLWELWLVQGLERNRFALINKTHHALVDGVAGVDIATVLFDIRPVPEQSEQSEPWVPHPQPSSAELAARGVRELVETPLKLTQRALNAARNPEGAARRAVEAVEALAEVAWNFTNPAPELPLNVEIGSHRRFCWTRSNLEDFKRIKNALGGTVNDVVLTVVSGALRSWLQGRGIRTEGLELRALVPVSIREQDDQGHLGNRIAAMRGPLPVYIEDPVKRLDIVRAAMDDLKDSKQALGAEVISRFNDFAPPTLLAQAARINFSTRLFNLIVTNVPGPQIPLYVLGRELQDVFPVAFLPEHHALAIAIMSYNGTLNFGLLADYDSMEDVELIADALAESLKELLDAAAGVEARAEADLAAGADLPG
ncbi:MAG: wax ester/triacylglycerol synthase family O-acyltransferase [Actinomycetota bacterium]|nr:wax ester/triacylglycerol synthase family O-acyltransferase [Actinomycetota bacterium]